MMKKTAVRGFAIPCAAVYVVQNRRLDKGREESRIQEQVKDYGFVHCRDTFGSIHISYVSAPSSIEVGGRKSQAHEINRTPSRRWHCATTF